MNKKPHYFGKDKTYQECIHCNEYSSYIDGNYRKCKKCDKKDKLNWETHTYSIPLPENISLKAICNDAKISYELNNSEEKHTKIIIKILESY